MVSGLLTGIEAAERIGVGLGVLRRMRIAGKAPPWVFLGGAYRYDAAGVERWRREHGALLKPAQAAALLCVDESTIRRWRRCGRGPDPLTIGRAHFYPEQWLADFIARLEQNRVTGA